MGLGLLEEQAVEGSGHQSAAKQPVTSTGAAFGEWFNGCIGEEVEAYCFRIAYGGTNVGLPFCGICSEANEFPTIYQDNNG
jgi:hypothetical protein